MKGLCKGLAWAAIMAVSTAALVADSAEWLMRRHDPSGCSATETRVRPPLRVAWRTRVTWGTYYPGQHCVLVTATRVIAFSPAAGYPGDQAPRAECFTADRGKRVWQYSPRIRQGAAISGAADSAVGRMFVLWRDGGLHRCLLEALSLTDGSVLWSRPFAVNTSEFTRAGKMILLTEATPAGERQLALSGDDGHVVWEEPTTELTDLWKRGLGGGNKEEGLVLPSRYVGTSAPAVAGDLVVFGSYTHRLYGRDLETGELRWRYVPTLEYVTGGFSSISLSRGRVFFGYSGFVYSSNAADPTVRPSRRLYKNWGDRASGVVAAVGGGRVFAPGYANHWLNALDEATLQPLWSKPGSFGSFPAVAGDTVWVSRDRDYFLGTPAGLHGYDFEGRLIWFTPGEFTEPAIANGRIYLLDETPGPNPRSPAVVCLAPHPAGAPFRNLALVLVGEVQRGGPFALRVHQHGGGDPAGRTSCRGPLLQGARWPLRRPPRCGTASGWVP